MKSSYVCERTVEYALIPILSQILQVEYKNVAPVFPWITRETSNISKAVHRGDQFKIITLFARRPKIRQLDTSKISFTINDGLNIFQALASAYGIPVICGIPLASNVWDLSSNVDVNWYALDSQTSSNYLLDAHSVIKDCAIKKIDNSKILDLTRRGQTHCIESLKEFLHFANRNQRTSPYGPRYKPVYFLLRLKNIQ